MRVITAYGRLLEALEVLSVAMSRGIAHVGGSARELSTLDFEINNLRENLLATQLDNPHAQVKPEVLDAIREIYESAYRARFWHGSESSFDEFKRAAAECESAIMVLYAGGGSETWGRFPPR